MAKILALITLIAILSLSHAQNPTGVLPTNLRDASQIQAQQGQFIGLYPGPASNTGQGPPTSTTLYNKIKRLLETGREFQKLKLCQTCKIDIDNTPIKSSLELDRLIDEQLRNIELISFEEFQLNHQKKKAELLFLMKEQVSSALQNAYDLDDENDNSKAKRRLLESVSNQYGPIDEGNIQAYDSNFIYLIRGYTFKVIRILGTEMGEIYSHTYEEPLFPMQIHVSNDYVGVVLRRFQTFRAEEGVVVDVYKNTGMTLKGVATYEKDGHLLSTREQGNHILLVSHQSMEKIDYNWEVSGFGEIESNIYFGTSADLTNGGIGSASRDVALIPLGEITEEEEFKSAQYLFCDFAAVMSVSEDLNLFVASSAYFNGRYRTVIQTLRMYQGGVWGRSYWAATDGYIYHPFQMDEYFDTLRVLMLETGDYRTEQYVTIVMIPMRDFNPESRGGEIISYAGMDGLGFLASHFKDNGLYMVFAEGNIKTFIPIEGNSPSVLKINQHLTSIYPYGDKYFIGVGSSASFNDVAIVTLRKVPFGLRLANSFELSSETQSYTYSTWFTYLALNFDYEHKRLIFPIYSNDPEPHRYGYYHLYADPDKSCLSNLPVPPRCSSLKEVTAPLVGKVFKHWDDRRGYQWTSGKSEVAYRSIILDKNQRQYLYTGSFCQLQARIIQPENMSPPLWPVPNPGIVEVLDLCE